ncbi:MAG: SLC13 family permease [Fervidicoccaceae archaeon]
MTYQYLLGWLMLIMLISFLMLRSRNPKMPVWAFMSFLAFLSIIGKLVSIEELPTVIDLNVIFFLIGMFSIVSLAESSGLLSLLSYWFITKLKSTYSIMIVSSIVFGLMAAFAVNDTIAVMGPPIIYTISRATGISLEALLLVLAFSITIGSVTTPIGNPQNVLISVSSGMKAPFISFMSYLFVPTLINLIITPLIISFLLKVPRKGIEIGLIAEESLKNKRDALIASLSLISVISLMLANDIFRLRGEPHIEEIGFIPFLVASAMYFFVEEPRKVIKEIDWGTIMFFITMFIAMQGIWNSGVSSDLISLFMKSKPNTLFEPIAISTTSIILSQLLSNVPFVKLFINYMNALGFTGEDVKAWVSLAMSSTIAGNLTLFGAASNIIILEVVESKFNTTIKFTTFLRVGALVTAVNLVVYLLFIIFF